MFFSLLAQSNHDVEKSQVNFHSWRGYLGFYINRDHDQQQTTSYLNKTHNFVRVILSSYSLGLLVEKSYGEVFYWIDFAKETGATLWIYKLIPAYLIFQFCWDGSEQCPKGFIISNCIQLNGVWWFLYVLPKWNCSRCLKYVRPFKTNGQFKLIQIESYLWYVMYILSLIHIWRCRRIERCRSRWSPYH